MQAPTRSKSEFKVVVGVDEVGRGPIAGPVSVGVFAFLDARAAGHFRRVKDSKQLSHKARLLWLERIDLAKKKGLVSCNVVHVGERVIDQKGIVHAINHAMKVALARLRVPAAEVQVLLDGGLKAPREYSHQETFIKGDERRMVIALASIVAKESRDALMTRVSKLHPGYGFEVHKGYGTREHYKNIRKLGLCKAHRRSFLSKLRAVDNY